MKKTLLILLLFLASLSLFGCERDDEGADIYTSIYPVYFLTTAIVQDKLTVKQIYPAGRDVHEYDPGSTANLIKMAEADLMFYIGAGLEAFIEKAKKTIFNNADIQLVELSEYITLCRQTETGYVRLDKNDLLSNQAHMADMHVWLDPLRMVTFAEVIADELIKFYPEYQEEFQANAQIIIDKLKKLDKQFIDALSNPEYDKIMLVDHDAYLYWEERYQIKRIRIRVDNESCDNIPSVIINNIEKAKEHNIKYIVTTAHESLCGLVNTYIKALEAEEIELHPASSITTKEQENNQDYFSIMESNLEKLLTLLPKKS